MVNKFPGTVLFVCMLKNLRREKGTSVNRQDFKLAVALYLAQQLCGSPLKHISLDSALHSSFWAMYHYFLLLFVFPTNPVWLRSSSDII